MSRYLVKVTDLGGSTGYLMLGRITKRKACATRYPHPSNARQAENNFRERHPAFLCVTSLIDSRHPRKGFPLWLSARGDLTMDWYGPSDQPLAQRDD